MTFTEVVVLVGAMTTAALGVLAVVGLSVRYVLLPWLREHLVEPVLQRVEAIQNDVKVAAGMFDSHIDRSSTEWGRMWNAIHDLREALPRHKRNRVRREED